MTFCTLKNYVVTYLFKT